MGCSGGSYGKHLGVHLARAYKFGQYTELNDSARRFDGTFRLCLNSGCTRKRISRAMMNSVLQLKACLPRWPRYPEELQPDLPPTIQWERRDFH